VVAKVARDRYMELVARRYAGYGFERHVGYGTAAHRAALAAGGVSAAHRRSVRPVAALLGLGEPTADGIGADKMEPSRVG
jgi:ribonuclease HII